MPAPRPVSRKVTTSGSLLGEWIRKTRLDQGISQRALADRSGLSRSYVCDIERGRGAQPSVATLDKLAAALGVSRADLMQASGLIDRVTSGERETDEERRLLAVYRDLSDSGRALIARFARFVHADEHQWIQQQLMDSDTDVDTVVDLRPSQSQPAGPMLFDDAGYANRLDPLGSGGADRTPDSL